MYLDKSNQKLETPNVKDLQVNLDVKNQLEIIPEEEQNQESRQKLNNIEGDLDTISPPNLSQPGHTKSMLGANEEIGINNIMGDISAIVPENDNNASQVTPGFKNGNFYEGTSEEDINMLKAILRPDEQQLLN